MSNQLYSDYYSIGVFLSSTNHVEKAFNLYWLSCQLLLANPSLVTLNLIDYGQWLGYASKVRTRTISPEWQLFWFLIDIPPHELYPLTSFLWTCISFRFYVLILSNSFVYLLAFGEKLWIQRKPFITSRCCPLFWNYLTHLHVF